MALEIKVMMLDETSGGLPAVRRFEKGEILIGRAEENDLVLADPAVSSVHARLSVEKNIEGKVIIRIRDLGSTNGTYVGNLVLGRHEGAALNEGDRVLIGNYIIVASYAGDLKTKGKLIEIGQRNGKTASAAIKAEELIAGLKNRSASKITPEPAAEETPEPGFESADAPDATPVPEPEPGAGAGLETPPEPMTEEQALAVPEPEAESGLAPEDLTEPLTPLMELAKVTVTAEASAETLAKSVSLLEYEIPAQETDLPPLAEELPQVAAGVEQSPGEVPEPEGPSGSVPEEPKPIEPAPALPEQDRAVQPIGAEISCLVCDDVLNFDFVANKLVTLAGRVTHKGSPLEGVRVSVGDAGWAETDAQGRFRFEKLIEGTPYVIRAEKEHYLFKGENAAGVLSGDMEVELAATRLCTLRGKIMHGGQPLPGAEVFADPLGKTVTAEDGSYFFENVPEDTRIKIKVTKDGFVIKAV